jgi:hypothetical protein
MFTYHCWVEIEHSGYLTDLIEGRIHYPEYKQQLLDITTRLQSIIEQEDYLHKRDISIIDGSNGMLTFHFSGMQNHYDSGPESTLELIKENAPGSLGLLCMLNTEYEGMEHQYQIYKLINNTIEKANDFSFHEPDTF